MKWIAAMTAAMIVATGTPALAQESPNLSPDLGQPTRAGYRRRSARCCYRRGSCSCYRRATGSARRWIRERDYSCKINGDTIDTSCIVSKTALRADQLERALPAANPRHG
jgi:hypothetical protein